MVNQNYSPHRLSGSVFQSLLWISGSQCRRLQLRMAWLSRASNSTGNGAISRLGHRRSKDLKGMTGASSGFHSFGMLEGSLRSKVCDQIEHIEPGQLSQIYWILRSDTLLSFIINHLLAKSGAKHFDQYPVLLFFRRLLRPPTRRWESLLGIVWCHGTCGFESAWTRPKSTNGRLAIPFYGARLIEGTFFARNTRKDHGFHHPIIGHVGDFPFNIQYRTVNYHYF